MNQSHDTCARFAALLTEYLQGDLSSGEMTWMVAHRDECARCMDILQTAADTEAALASCLAAWRVPEPPDRLREKILRRIRASATPEQVHCADLRADLDAWRCGDLASGRSRALQLHSERCTPCAQQVRTAEGVERLLASWAAPEPRAGFAKQVLEALERGRRPASQPVPGRLFHRGRVAVAAAAALLLTAYLGLRNHDSDPVNRRHSEPPVQQLLAHYHRDVRLRAVSTEQFPGGIGSFDIQPLILDRGRRISGNAFHRSLRKTLAHAALNADREAGR